MMWRIIRKNLGVIDSYESLKKDMRRNLDGLENLGNIVDKTKRDLNNVEKTEHVEKEY